MTEPFPLPTLAFPVPWVQHESSLRKTTATKLVQEIKNGASVLDQNIKDVQERMDQLKKWRIHAAKILSETGETVSNSTPTKSKRKQNKRSRAESIENSPDLSPTTSVAGLSDVETFSDVASNHSVEHVKKKQRMTLQSTHLGKELAVSLRNSPSGSDTRAMVQLPVSLDPDDTPATTTGLWSYLRMAGYFTPIEPTYVSSKLQLADEKLDDLSENQHEILTESKCDTREQISKLSNYENFESFSVDPAFGADHTVTQRLLSAMQAPVGNGSDSIEANSSLPLVPLNFEPLRDPVVENGLVDQTPLGLEDRLRIELKMIGLLDVDEAEDDALLEERRDDEISVEIRRLTSQLQCEICEGNRKVAFLRKVVMQRIDEELYAIRVEEESKLLLRKYNKMWKRRLEQARKKKLKAKKKLRLQAEKLGLDAAFPLPK